MNETENETAVEAMPQPYPLGWEPVGSAFFFGIDAIGEVPTVPILGLDSGMDFFQCD